MYYESYRKKKPRRRRRRWSLKRAVLRLLMRLLALAVLAAVVLYFLPVSLFMVEPDYELSLATDLPSSPLNVLVLGVDALSDGAQRSDTIMIASIDRGMVRLTSLQRDMVVNIPGHGQQKINAAYAYGGPELVMRTVNEALDMNIVKYVVVDFAVLVKMVDALGGVRMDITAGEMEHINKNVVLSAGVFIPLGYRASELTEYGENVRLDGLQALAYARIRKLDSDFVRTSRQRAVIMAMLEELRGDLWNPIAVTRFLAAGLSGVETNLNPVELVSLGEKALFSGDMQQLRLPVDGSYSDNGSTLTVNSWKANVSKLREFIYAK